MAKETKDTTLQLRVSSDTLKKARDVFEQEGKTISKAVRAYLEETVRLGKTPFRVELDEKEQEFNTMSRVEEYAMDNIVGTEFFPTRSGKSAEERLHESIFGTGLAKDMEDSELRAWGSSVGLPEGLSLTTLAELHDCGLFPDNVLSPDDKSMRILGNEEHYDVMDEANIRQNIALVGMRLLANALSYEYTCRMIDD